MFFLGIHERYQSSHLTLGKKANKHQHVCIRPRHQPAGADRAGQATVQLSRDRGGHLQQTWSSGPEESVAGWHPDTGKEQ